MKLLVLQLKKIVLDDSNSACFAKKFFKIEILCKKLEKKISSFFFIFLFFFGRQIVSISQFLKFHTRLYNSQIRSPTKNDTSLKKSFNNFFYFYEYGRKIL